jgi:signal transduction histidine kinase
MKSDHAPMNEAPERPIVTRAKMLRAFIQWFTRSGFEPDQRAPVEAIILRALGFGYLALFIAGTVAARPHPGLHGKGPAILGAMVVLVACVVASMTRPRTMPAPRQIGLLLGVTAASAVLGGLQPKGIWQAGPYFVVIVAAAALDRRAALLTALASVATVVAVAAAAHHTNAAWSLAISVPPWYFVMRLIRAMRIQHEELKASRAAESRAAAEAERGRLAREMHDVLAHSLSALALQLESTRLLARDRNTDAEVVRALDGAHHLAAQGLDEVRRAIAAARGDQLPGPERLQDLAQAFEQQSGVPVALAVTGEPRELAPDARLAIYRTAQEALTNVRRHSTAESVNVRLDYRRDATVLAVEDHAAGPPPPAPIGGGYGLTGMRERAELLGGSLRAEPTDSGFLVELWLPEPKPVEPTTALAPGR